MMAQRGGPHSRETIISIEMIPQEGGPMQRIDTGQR